MMVNEGPMIKSPGYRSLVPDLIFEDEQDSRVDDLGASLHFPATVDATTPLHRITVFVTYRCNLACPYCKTIARDDGDYAKHPEKRLTLRYADFERHLDSYAGTPIRHLHFTGGEASLVNDLPAMIRLAKARGVGCVSTTSNGTLPVERYQELVRAGLDELRISLDAADAELGAALAARPGAWERTVETIHAMDVFRAEFPFFLILNAVIGKRNASQLSRLLRFYLSLNPDDIKLITDVDAKDDLASSPDNAQLLTEATQLLAAFPPDKFPLLRRKLRTVFAQDSIGLGGIRAQADGKWRCYIPLSERTVDGANYYPCSVYLREGGKPIGKIDEPQDKQRVNTAAFVERGDCLDDPICKRYCLHCTRNFNVRANERRDAEVTQGV